jgi:ATP adenylyltransferase
VKKAKKRAHSIDVAGGLKDIWPSERDFMQRPERFKYVRKLVKPKGCVFCNAVKSGVKSDSLVLYKDDQVVVMLNKYPYNNGHLLVVPVRHCGQLGKLKKVENQRLSEALRQTAVALEKAYDCAGLNLGMNHGAVAGAGIPEHLHWHVVPRWAGDTNFFPLIAETKVHAETLAQTYDKLLPYFDAKKFLKD